MKRFLFPVLLLLALISVGVYVLTHKSTPTIPKTASSPQKDFTAIKKRFGCGRSTADMRMTDPLCTNLEYADKLAARGITFLPTAPDKNELALVAVTNGKQSQPIVNTKVSVGIKQVDPCLKEPCPATIREFMNGVTDELGVITLPRSRIPAQKTTAQSIALIVKGHKPVLVALDKTSHYLFLVP